MSLKSRSTSPSLRGSGGGGKITVNDHTGEAISTGVRTIEWQTLDQFGFTVSVDPFDETRVVVGVAPVFESKLSWSSVANTQARIAVSDPAEPDPFDEGGWSNSAQKATNNPNPAWVSSLGRGLGEDSVLNITVQHSDNVVADETFTCVADGVTTQNGITVTVTGYAEDGDGSAYKGVVSIEVDLNSYTAGDFSGKFQVDWQYTEHKWAEDINFSETFFYDKNPDTPVITGNPTAREDDLAANRVTKFLSGIQYFTTGSSFQFESPTIDNHNQDTSHPDASLTVDSGDFGINTFTSSPWIQGGEWTNVVNEDSGAGFDFAASKVIDVTNFRHIGEAVAVSTVRDSWASATVKNSNIVMVAIDTVTNPSTDNVEYFDEENKRIAIVDLTSDWDSQTYCTDGDMVFYGGRGYQGDDLPTVLRNVSGALGSKGSLITTLPNETTLGVNRQNPNYSGFVKTATLWRRFLAPNITTSYPTLSMNITTNGVLSTKLSSGDIRIYVWKLDSIDPASVNLTLPTSHSNIVQSASLANSLWGHQPYDFGSFDDGASQTASGSGVYTNIVDNLLTLTFGDYAVKQGVLVRIDINKGTYLEEVSVNFP